MSFVLLGFAVYLVVAGLLLRGGLSAAFYKGSIQRCWSKDGM